MHVTLHGISRATRPMLAVLVAALGVASLAAVAPAPAFAEGAQVVRPGPPVLEEEPVYDASYLFAMSRAVARSDMHTAIKPPIMLFTIPVDIALLPISLIAGFF